MGVTMASPCHPPPPLPPPLLQPLVEEIVKQLELGDWSTVHVAHVYRETNRGVGW